MDVPRSLIALGSVVLCFLVPTSCVSTAASSGDPFAEVPGAGGPVRFTIQNNDFRDASVYGYWNGVRERIGSVTGKTIKTFETDWKSETFSFFVDFVGGGEYHSETIEVWPGDHLDFVIMPSW